MSSFILAITTYNRIDYLKRMLNTFLTTMGTDFREVVIADDGSADGTLEYIQALDIPEIKITLIRNNRKGVHHQFNTIVKYLEDKDFDVCFKCDDDIEFVKPGWDKLYFKALKQSGFDHLCFFDTTWRADKNRKVPVEKGNCISYCSGKDVQGAFFTITPRMIREVGYMDVTNFGYRGVGHIDYSLRSCRLGFNDINHPFDVKYSNLYIRYQVHDYRSALPDILVRSMETNEESKRKYDLINQARMYIAHNEMQKPMDKVTERELLLNRILSLEKEKDWYEAELGNYRKFPRWYLMIGKILNRLK